MTNFLFTNQAACAVVYSTLLIFFNHPTNRIRYVTRLRFCHHPASAVIYNALLSFRNNLASSVSANLLFGFVDPTAGCVRNFLANSFVNIFNTRDFLSADFRHPDSFANLTWRTLYFNDFAGSGYPDTATAGWIPCPATRRTYDPTSNWSRAFDNLCFPVPGFDLDSFGVAQTLQVTSDHL